jgi:phenylacetate-CoA ligase
VRQCYGTAELGLVAYETEDPAHGLAIDEDVIVEIVRAGGTEPVPDGEVGEVVVTTFHHHLPLIRLGTGDLSAIVTEPADGAGRTARRLRGWMGRADQTTKVRGMFVHPHQIASVERTIAEIGKARLEVEETDGIDSMRLVCEVVEAGDALADRIGEAVRAACGLRAEVRLVAPGSLPNDGKVIDDRRPAP